MPVHLRCVRSLLAVSWIILMTPADLISAQTTTTSAASATTQPANDALPDPFLFTAGHRVATAADWPARRREILEQIQRDEYGHLPPPPKSIEFILLASHRPKSLDAVQKQYKIVCHPADGGEIISFVVDLLIPKGDGPFPVIVRGDACWGELPVEITKQILGRGYILAQFNRCELAPDNDNQRVALYASYAGGDFGAIAAWAWGFHRAVDLLVSLPIVQRDHIAITGHSRGGKAALLAGATDERVALTAPNCSGCCGTGSFRIRGPDCERIENITKSFPFWFTPRFRQFAGREDELPFDQHFVTSLVGPRALLTTQALDDLHANPRGTVQVHRATREVYQFLGHSERIAIQFRPGGHEHNADDFGALLDFADQVFGGKQSPRDWNVNPFPDDPAAFTWTAGDRR
jgi:hypothetical protein